MSNDNKMKKNWDLFFHNLILEKNLEKSIFAAWPLNPLSRFLNNDNEEVKKFNKKDIENQLIINEKLTNLTSYLFFQRNLSKFNKKINKKNCEYILISSSSILFKYSLDSDSKTLNYLYFDFDFDFYTTIQKPMPVYVCSCCEDNLYTTIYEPKWIPWDKLKGEKPLNLTFWMYDKIITRYNREGTYLKRESYKKLFNLIKENNSRVTPSGRIGVIDTETILYKDKKNVVVAIGSITGTDPEDSSQWDSKVLSLYEFPKLNADISWEDLQSNSHFLIIKFLKSLITLENDGGIYYVHNLAHYDSNYILYALMSRHNQNKDDKIKYKFLIKNNQIIKMNLTYGLYEIIILDSYLMMRNSLKDLSKTFNLEENKSLFPYNFYTIETMNYEGSLPDKKYFNVSQKEYDILKNDFQNKPYNIKEELMDYLLLDLKILYQIICLFIQNVWEVTGINPKGMMTISQLALNVLFSKFKVGYKKYKTIPKIKDPNDYKDLSKSLIGGINVIYKHYGENLYHYDVNSFYPSCILNEMPGDSMIIKDYKDSVPYNPKTNKNKLGIYSATVETPNTTDILALLPARVHMSEINYDTIYPLGQFKGWYTSIELDLAHKQGYKISIDKEYLFNKIESPFIDYVNKFYNLKNNSTGMHKALYKSLLNNLIGRFGIDLYSSEYKFMDKEDVKKLNSEWTIKEIKEVNNDMRNVVLVNYYSYNIKEGKSLNEFQNASVVTTAFVNSYARAKLMELKLKLLAEGVEIYYCDTDSIVINKELDKDLVGSEIGKFKLEHKIKRAYFLMDKFYFYVKEDNSIYKVTKSINQKELITEEDCIKYFNDEKISTIRKSSIKRKGWVEISEKEYLFKKNLYKKRNNEEIFLNYNRNQNIKEDLSPYNKSKIVYIKNNLNWID